MRQHDFVFVNADRGKTPGIARITKVTTPGFSPEADILFEDGTKMTLYTAHLYQTAECHRRRKAFMAERASKIGNGNGKKKNS